MSTLLEHALRPESIRLELQATTWEEAIHELVGMLAETEELKDPGAVERAVLARERTLSTGMPGGLALPHGKTDAVERLMAAIGVKQEGLPFDCPDGKPARLVILTVSPSSRSGPHIQFMAEIARLLRTPGALEELVACDSPRAILDRLTRRH